MSGVGTSDVAVPSTGAAFQVPRRFDEMHPGARLSKCRYYGYQKLDTGEPTLVDLLSVETWANTVPCGGPWNLVSRLKDLTCYVPCEGANFGSGRARQRYRGGRDTGGGTKGDSAIRPSIPSHFARALNWYLLLLCHVLAPAHVSSLGASPCASFLHSALPNLPWTRHGKKMPAAPYAWVCYSRSAALMLCSRRLLVAFLLQLRLHLQIPGYSTPLHQQVYFRALCVGRHGLLLHWSLAIRAIALRQRDAGRKTATLPVFVLSVLGLVSYVKGLWPAPVMGDLLLVHAPSLVLFQCLLIFIALVRHVHDSLLAPLGRPRIPAIAAPLIKRKALRVVLLHFVLELAPVHLRYHPAVPILVRVMATAGAKDGGSPAQWWTRFSYHCKTKQKRAKPGTSSDNPASPAAVQIAASPRLRLPAGLHIVGLPRRPNLSQLEALLSHVAGLSPSLAGLEPSFQLEQTRRSSRKIPAFFLSHAAFAIPGLADRILEELLPAAGKDKRGRTKLASPIGTLKISPAQQSATTALPPPPDDRNGGLTPSNTASSCPDTEPHPSDGSGPAAFQGLRLVQFTAGDSEEGWTCVCCRGDILACDKLALLGSNLAQELGSRYPSMDLLDDDGSSSSSTLDNASPCQTSPGNASATT
ncbi:hypothetical protein AK812_SmicGene5444 [Symbiodinium microadriaticum]|uniref:Uncharacterized protein n=1 Tax=Symbiodinium microadriaticum TaxID=2951 RepID=A0A1Q9ETR8_SYMMI|nr:hypothetical protein AK812_SmicGene5444 [Symbiodinium microadriaticum]